MQTDTSASIAEITNRFPGTEPDAVGTSARDTGLLIGHLACANDLTLAEAAEVVEEWQSGLSVPAGPEMLGLA